MKVAGIIFCILLTSFQSVSFKGVDPKSLTFEQVEAYVQSVDVLKEKKKLTNYEIPEMTAWGSLTAFWGKKDLMLAESVYQAEAGFTSRTVYFNEGEICRIVVQKHIANWAEYERDHGAEEFDASKITYTDVLYDYTFGKEVTFRILKDKQMVATAIDQELMETDLQSAKALQLFLEETDF